LTTYLEAEATALMSNSMEPARITNPVIARAPSRALRGLPVSSDTPRRWAFRPDRDWRFHSSTFLFDVAHVLINIACSTVFRWDVRGRENVPHSGPLIVAANHASFLDPPIIGAAAAWRLFFMGKEELFRIPCFGWLISRMRAFPVRRGMGDRRALRWTLHLLDHGEKVLIFPEGRRNRSGELLKAEPGISHVILKSKATVLPVALSGTDRILVHTRPFPTFGRIRVRFGEPLTFEEFYGQSLREAHEAIGDRIMSSIREMLQSMPRR